jgi:hypothetical protein
VKALAVFAMVFGLDLVWARYTIAVAARRPMAASLYAAFIFSVGGLTTMAYMTDKWMLVPAALGAFAGTYVATRRGKHGQAN